MQLDIITPEKTIFSGEIESVTVPTTTGHITILPHHVNLSTQVVPGEATILANKKAQYLGITGGFLQVASNKVTILSDYAVRSEDIEVEKALEAQKRAEELLKKQEEGISEQDLAIARSELARSVMQLHVANRRKHRMRNIGGS